MSFNRYIALSAVMPGLDPGIHALLSLPKDVDGRVKPSHDDLATLVFRHCEERLVRRSSTSEGGSDEAIHSLLGAMDCFAEPVIGRAFARPVGSQ
jgi:hypothetical protein